MANDTAGFKVGDRVRILSDVTGIARDYVGQTVLLTERIGRAFRAIATDGQSMLLTLEEMELIDPTDPAPRPEIMLDGHRYVLAPAAEAVAEVRLPRVGEIWRTNSGNFCQISDGQRITILHTGQIQTNPTPLGLPSRWQFVAPSLADALASGALTADMLRGES